MKQITLLIFTLENNETKEKVEVQVLNVIDAFYDNGYNITQWTAISVRKA